MRDWLIGYLIIGLCITILGKIFYPKPIDRPIQVVLVATFLWPVFMFKAWKDALREATKEKK